MVYIILITCTEIQKKIELCLYGTGITEVEIKPSVSSSS